MYASILVTVFALLVSLAPVAGLDYPSSAQPQVEDAGIQQRAQNMMKKNDGGGP